MLFSAVGDRSGVAYQEYRCVYGEDVAAALRFLFNAMAPKDEPDLVLQGIPAMLYLDLLASRLRTPLQIEQHLTLALETGYQASEKPVGEAIVDFVLSKQIDDLEPTLTRHGYTARTNETAP